MLQTNRELSKFLPGPEFSKLQELLLSDEEYIALHQIYGIPADLDSFTKALQQDSIILSKARVLLIVN